MQIGNILRPKKNHHDGIALTLFIGVLLLITYSAISNLSDSGQASHFRYSLSIQYLHDINNEFSVDEIVGKQSDFIDNPDLFPSGVKVNNYWFKIDIGNVKDFESDLFLQLTSPGINKAALYSKKSDNTWLIQQAGIDLPLSNWSYANRNIVFPLNKADLHEQILYLSLQSKRGIRSPLNIMTRGEFTNAEALPLSLWGGYYAILFFICLSTLFIYLTSKFSPYVYYCTYTLFTGLFVALHSGIGYEFLWPTHPLWNVKLNTILPCLMVIMLIGFTRNLLNTSSFSTTLDKLLIYCSWTHVIFLLPAVSFNYDFSNIVIVTSQVTYLAILAIGIRLIKVTKAITYFVAALVFLISGMSIFSLAEMGVLPLNAMTTSAIEFCSIPQLLLLSFALTSRIQQTIQDRNIAIIERRVALDQKNIALKTANRALEENISSKNEFLTTISHELRTPLHGIMGSIELMQQINQPDQVKSLLNISDRCSRDMLNLIENILDLSEARGGDLLMEPKQLNLVESLKNLSKHHEDVAQRKSLHYMAIIAENVPKYVLCDGHRVFQVLDQIIGNAMKFTESGSVNFVVTKHEEGSTEKESILHFCVTDTGIGIVPEKVSTLFEPFTRAHSSISREYDGLGIGLALSYRLLKSMGGDLKFTTINHRGSIFEVTLRLPHCSTGSTMQWEVLPAKTQSAKDSEESIEKRKQQKILIVDDNPSNIMVLKALVKNLGYSVETVTNGELAVKHVEEFPTDLILMDCQMPVMDGYEATRCIREFSAGKSAVPIVAVTANAMSTDKEKCLDAGMDDYIAKPVKKDTLEQKISLWMHKKDDQDNQIMH